MSKEKDEDVKENKKEKNSSNDKTNNKKTLKIVGAIVAVILIVGVGAFLGYKSYMSNKSVGSDWGDTYYDFILDSKNNDDKKSKIQNNSKIEFIQVPDIDEPVMVVNYEKEEKDYSDIYFIDNGEVKNAISLGPSEVEMLYNIADKEYDWYIHTSTETEDKYTTLSSTINKEVEKETPKEDNSKEETPKEDNSKEETPKEDNSNDDASKEETTEYVYKKGEEISVEKVDGSKITMPKFDSEFVEVDVEVDSIDYNKDLTDKELKESLTTGVDKYKTNEEITTNEVKEEVSEKEQEVIAKKEEMKKAEEEVQKKKEEEARKAEEERKRAEEEARKGLTVGGYTIKYGTYAARPDGPYAGYTVVLKPNGQCEYKGESCTYTIGTHNFAQDASEMYMECLIITFGNGKYKNHLYPTSTTRIVDGGLGSFDYQG